MPRNVVTLVPRRLSLPSPGNDETRQKIEQAVASQYRARFESDPERIEMDFSKRRSLREARTGVAATLYAIDPDWERLFEIYPTESSLRDMGE